MGSSRAAWKVGLAFVLLPIILAGTAEAAPRWAVLTSGSVQRSGVGNLLTVRLSELDGIELVERDEVEKVLREQELGALVENAATGRPRKIARLLRAERLLVIDGSWTQSRAELRIVIDDTVIGARLFDEPLTVSKPDPEKVCSMAVDLLEDSMRRFPEGIRSAIAVPFFVSKGLEKRHDSLQQEYAKVVSQSLMRAPGIAVVSLDELQNIRAELALSSSEINRVVPLQVNGEFTVLPAPKAETPQCHLTVTISDGASTLETIDHPSIELPQVRELLVGSVTERILAKVGDDSVQPMSMAEQEAALAARADRFVEYGAYPLAIKLREAILLLNPRNVDQRLALLHNHGASHSLPDLPYTFPHVEYLLKNRLIKLPQAQKLIPRRDYYFPPKPSSLPPHLNDNYVYAITLAKLAADLPCDPNNVPEWPVGRPLSAKAHEARQRREFLRLVAWEVLKPANEWNQSRKLKDLREALCRVPDFEGLFPLMPGIATSGRFSEKEVSEFCKALRATKRPGQIHFAEYVELLLEAECHPAQITHSDLAAIESLEKLAIGFQGPIGGISHNEYWQTVKELAELKSRLSGLARRNEAKANGESPSVLPVPAFPPPRVETTQDPMIRKIRDQGAFVGENAEITKTQLFKDEWHGFHSGMVICLTRQWRGGDDGLKDIANLRGIKALYVIEADVTDEGMRHLRYAPTELYLANTRITKKGLEKLSLSGTSVIWFEDRTGRFLNDDALKLLEKAKDLKCVGLIGPGFGEKAREFVAKSTRLIDARLNPEDRSAALVASTVKNPITEPPEAPITWEQGVDLQPIAAWTHLESLPRSVHLERHQDDSDLVWDDHGVHLLSRSDNDELALKTIFTEGKGGPVSSREKVSRARSDGENLWVVTNERIVVVSESGETLAEFSEETGLPSYTSSHRIRSQTSDAVGVLPSSGGRVHDHKRAWTKDSAEPWRTASDCQELQTASGTIASVLPLGGGKCLALGRTGAIGRTWIAFLSLDGGKPGVRVLHMATRMLKPDGYGDPEMLAAPEQMDVVFHIPWACFYNDPRRPDKRLVILGRVHDAQSGVVANTPLAVDLESFKVTTLAQQVPGLSEVRGGTAARCVQGALVLSDWGRLEVFCPQGEDRFVKTAIAEERTQNLILVEHGGSVYSPGHTWYRIGPRRNGDVPATDFAYPRVIHELSGGLCVEVVSDATLPAQNNLARYASSSLFGIWAMEKGGSATYAIDPEAPFRKEVSPFAKFVPAEDLERHEAAVQAIRDLGGFVDRSDRCPRLDEPRRRMAPGSTVVSLTEQWRGGNEGLSHLCDLYGPIRLYLLSTPISDEGMTHLKELRELWSLVLCQTPVTAEGLRRLPLDQLYSIYLQGKPGCVDYSDGTLSALTNCRHLGSITLCGRGFTENAVPQLKLMRSLREVHVEGTLIPERCRGALGFTKFHGSLVPNEVADRVLASQESRPARFSALYLGGKDPSSEEARCERPFLASSIVLEAYRQAVLIAARDELGAQTRDHFLGETVEDADGALHVEPGWKVAKDMRNVTCEFRVVSGQDGASTRQITREVYEAHKLGKLFDFLDEASRSMFVSTLKECGLGGRGNRWLDDAPVPKEIEEQLAIPEFPAQYSAVRELHRLIREDGESPQRLASLVWGYLHLGYLTESLLHPMNEVFKMRAVLYARRLEHRSAATGHGRGITEVALSLAGLHEAAIDCGRSVGGSPPWLALGRPYYQYDFGEFARLRQRPELAAWAELYEFNALMYTGREKEAHRRQKELLAAYPTCQRFWTLQTYDPALNPVPNSEKPTRRFGACLYGELAGIRDLPLTLPPKVISEVGLSDDEFTTRREVMDSLSDPGGCGSLAADRHEFSWQVLGCWIREVSFTQVLLRAYYLQMRAQNGEAGETRRAWIALTDPLTKGHPWRVFLDVYGGGEAAHGQARSFPRDHAAQHALVHRFTPNDHPLWDGCEGTGAEKIYQVASSFRARFRCDHDVRHAYHKIMEYRYYSPLSRWEEHGSSMNCSPWNPWSIVDRVNKRPDDREVWSHLDVWWKHFENDPDVRRAIALAYARDKECELAADRLSTVVAASKLPDGEASEALANVYEELGDTAKAEATLKAFFAAAEAVTPEGTRIAFNRGRKLLENGDCQGAKTWFDQAAESHDQWGCFARTLSAELRGDYEASQRAARQLAATHPGNAFQWYWSCLRCNGEDRKTALEAVKRFRDLVGGGRLVSEQKSIRAHTLIILGLEGVESPEKVCNAFLEADVLPTQDAYAALHVLTIAMEHDLPDVRKRLLERMNRPNAEEILARVFDRLADQGDEDQTALTDADFAKLVEGASPSERVDAEYFFAKCLAIHGDEERACEHWRHVLATPTLIKITRNLTVHELRKRGMTDEEYRRLSGIAP